MTSEGQMNQMNGDQWPQEAKGGAKRLATGFDFFRSSRLFRPLLLREFGWGPETPGRSRLLDTLRGNACLGGEVPKLNCPVLAARGDQFAIHDFDFVRRQAVKAGQPLVDFLVLIVILSANGVRKCDDE